MGLIKFRFFFCFLFQVAGDLFSIGLYLFDKTLDHFEDTEKTTTL